jgi:phosphoserine phosphatase RsbU/P
VQLGAGDVVVIYTDGITEAVNEAEEEFGLERLRRALAANGRAGADGIAECLVASTMQWSAKPQQATSQLL